MSASRFRGWGNPWVVSAWSRWMVWRWRHRRLPPHPLEKK